MVVSTCQCSPQAKFRTCQGTTVGHAMGGCCGHIKAFGISLFAYQRKLCTEACWADMPYILGRTLHVHVQVHVSIDTSASVLVIIRSSI